MKKLCRFIVVFMFLTFTGCSQMQYGAGGSPIDNDSVNVNDSSVIANHTFTSDNDSTVISDIDYNDGKLTTDTQSYIDNDVYLDVPDECYSLQSETIPYVIVNNSGKRVDVLLIPILEKETDEGWEKMDFASEIGFCGVADSIDTQRKGDLPLVWYADALSAGRYRLSFEMHGGEDSNNVKMLSDIFEFNDNT